MHADDVIAGHAPVIEEVVHVSYICTDCRRDVSGPDGHHVITWRERWAVMRERDRQAREQRKATAPPYGGAIEKCQAAVTDQSGYHGWRCPNPPKFVRLDDPKGPAAVCGRHIRSDRFYRYASGFVTGGRAPALEPIEEEWLP